MGNFQIAKHVRDLQSVSALSRDYVSGLYGALYYQQMTKHVAIICGGRRTIRCYLVALALIT